jgi:hypothetical protein
VEGEQATWIWLAVLTVLYAALFSSVFNFGDNERYRTHVARLQYSVIILAGWYWIKSMTPAFGKTGKSSQRQTGDI